MLNLRNYRIVRINNRYYIRRNWFFYEYLQLFKSQYIWSEFKWSYGSFEEAKNTFREWVEYKKEKKDKQKIKGSWSAW